MFPLSLYHRCRLLSVILLCRLFSPRWSALSSPGLAAIAGLCSLLTVLAFEELFLAWGGICFCSFCLRGLRIGHIKKNSFFLINVSDWRESKYRLRLRNFFCETGRTFFPRCFFPFQINCLLNVQYSFLLLNFSEIFFFLVF